jgi:AcrR family transcriptional regulator
MECVLVAVKRSYDASRRRDRAEQVRAAIIDAAHAMLLTEGYAGTTMPKIAKACGVSVEAVYKRFPGKPALVRAVVEMALRGVGPTAAETRSDAIAPGDLRQLLRGWGTLAAEVAPRVAPLLLVLRAAAEQDVKLTGLAAELDDNRRARMKDNAQRLADAGHLPNELSVAQATDVLWTYSSPELYELLVQRSGWDLEAYGAFISQGIAAQLHPQPSLAGRRPWPVDVTVPSRKG